MGLLRKSIRGMFLLGTFACLFGVQAGFAQTHQDRLDQGIKLYRVGQWANAVTELRQAQRAATGPGQLSAALYWIALAEFARGEYEACLRAINDLQQVAPAGMRMEDIIFYKGRALYYLKRPGEALPLFRSYGEVLNRQNTPNIQAERIALAYWIGECLYDLGQREQAAAQFTQVVNARPRSEKYEAAAYRLALIEQDAITKELLGTMSMSYTEYLEVLEEYQHLLAEAEMQIRALEAARAGGETSRADPLQRIRDLKAAAEKRRRELDSMAP